MHTCTWIYTPVHGYTRLYTPNCARTCITIYMAMYHCMHSFISMSVCDQEHMVRFMSTCTYILILTHTTRTSAIACTCKSTHTTKTQARTHAYSHLHTQHTHKRERREREREGERLNEGDTMCHANNTHLSIVLLSLFLLLLLIMLDTYCCARGVIQFTHSDSNVPITAKSAIRHLAHTKEVVIRKKLFY